MAAADPTLPFWGPTDSNIDWCEPNYVVTPYIAEFFNTISSVPISLFAILGLMFSRRYASTEIRYSFAYFIVILVGVGSVLFHGTLRRVAQACDELPMLYAAFTFAYITIDNTHFLPENNLSPQNSVLTKAKLQRQMALKSFLLACAVGETLIYYVFPELYILFLLGFGAVTTFTFFTTHFAIRKTNTVILGKHAGSASADIDDIEAGNKLVMNGEPTYADFSRVKNLFNQAMTLYGIAFAFWVTENALCQQLPKYAYFHAIWHLLSGAATYWSVQAQLAWRAALFDRQFTVDFLYGYIPYVNIRTIDSKSTVQMH